MGTLEQNVATLLFSVDALLGDDPLHESGTKHMIVDNWRASFVPPVHYDDVTKELRSDGSVSLKDIGRGRIIDFIGSHHLLDCAEAIREESKGLDADTGRYFSNLAHAADVMLRFTLSTPHHILNTPSFKERYMASTRLTDVKLVDEKEARENLYLALAKEYSHMSGSLRERVLQWKGEQGDIPPQVGFR